LDREPPCPLTFARPISEELWRGLGNGDSILNAAFPVFQSKYVQETSKEYPISINGKMRTTLNISLSASQDEVEKMVLDNDVVKKWTEGKPPKKPNAVPPFVAMVVIGPPAPQKTPSLEPTIRARKATTPELFKLT